MKKILFTATYAQPYLSGITDYIDHITQHLAKKNRVKLLVFRHDNSLKQQEKKQGVIIHRIVPDFKLSKGFVTWSYPCIAWAAVQQADEVFINLPQVESIWVVLAAKLQHKKLSVIYHCELVFESGFFNQCIALGANFLASIVCLLADSIIAYTTEYAEHSPVLKPFLHKVVAVIPPVKRFSASPKYRTALRQKTAGFGPIIGFAGRVSREKGLTFLLKALEQLIKKYPRIILLCAGPFGSAVAGEAAYYDELLTRIAAKKLPVIFLGRLSKIELSAFYQHITTLVLPSTNRTEAFGLVQAEALLAGTSVIAVDLPGVRTAVQLTNGGMIVPTKNPNALVHAVTEILENPTAFERGKITAQARQLFSLKKTLDWFSNYTT